MNYTETIPGGGMWSMRVPRHREIHLRAMGARANLSALFYNALNPLDRLNVPDTLKALHTAKLARGHVLMSDMGHAMASIVDDSLGWHDPLGGHSTAEIVEKSFGKGTYQEKRNEFLRNAHDNFLVELAKHGLGLRDLVANVNFFSKVAADDPGRLEYHPEHCPEGAFVKLRSEIDLLVVLSNCPHPMHPPGEYPRVPVEVSIALCEPAGGDDFCRNFRPECGRAMQLSERFFL
ncbi:MAG: urea amidolyase associated protein UAAP1 [bacterium]